MIDDKILISFDLIEEQLIQRSIKVLLQITKLILVSTSISSKYYLCRDPRNLISSLRRKDENI